MDVTSYLLGKKKGGGGGSNLQTKSVSVTSNGSTTINPDTGYDGMTKVNLTTNVQPNLETKSITITENTTTTLTPTSGKDGMSSVSITTNVSGGDKVLLPDGIMFKNSTCINMNWLSNADTSQITIGTSLFQNCLQLQSVPLFDTSNMTNMAQMFQYCSSLVSIPQFDTSSSTDFGGMCSGCTLLVDVPIIDMSAITKKQSISNVFQGCSSLSNNSLNNVLASLNTIVFVLTSNYKTLKYVGLSSEQTTICTTLSNWQALVDKGWTTGY